METPTRKKKINKTEKSQEYFEFVGVEDGKDMFKCKDCKRRLNGTKRSNLTAHLILHPEIYSVLCNDGPQIEYKRKKLLLNCVELVSVNGRPFRCLNDSAIFSMNEDILSELKSAGRELNLKDPHLNEVKEELKQVAHKIREKISAEVKDRAISLLVDIVTKRSRAFFGISIQYIIDNTVKVHSIGAIELEESHTGLYLANIIVERLKELNIQLKQIITISTDNGANVLKMIRDVESHLQTEMKEPTTPSKISQNVNSVPRNIIDFASEEATEKEIEAILAEEELTDDEALDIIFNEANADNDEPSDAELQANENLLVAVKSKLASDYGLDVVWDVTGVNCAEHTLQLGINDAIKATGTENRNLINLCRRVVKFLRLATTMHELKKENINYKRPRIDVVTRWGSLYVMVNIVHRFRVLHFVFEFSIF